MLLHVMSLPRYVRCDNSARTQAHTRDLPFRRVGFFGLSDADFETDAFEGWGEYFAKGWGDSFSCARFAAAALGE